MIYKRFFRLSALCVCVLALAACQQEELSSTSVGFAGTSTGTETTGGVDSTGTETTSTETPSPTTGRAVLSWTPPTTNTDGSVLTDLAGYKIYYGTAPGNYSEVLVIGSDLSSYVLENLSLGTWYFSISAFDGAGSESEKSDEVNKLI